MQVMLILEDPQDTLPDGFDVEADLQMRLRNALRHCRFGNV